MVSNGWKDLFLNFLFDYIDLCILMLMVLH